MRNGFDVWQGELIIWQLSYSYALDTRESLAQDSFKSENRAYVALYTNVEEAFGSIELDDVTWQ